MPNIDSHESFRRSLTMVFLARVNILAAFNLLFFVTVFLVVFLGRSLFPPVLYGEWSPWPFGFFQNNFILLMGIIFLFNLTFASFLTVTLPGFLFFPLSAIGLAYKAVLWGILLRPISGGLLLAALPTLFLEGEAYVFSACAGTVAGASWLVHRRLNVEEALSRKDAFKKGLRECLRMYFFVALLLLIAALVETTTFMFLQ